MFAQSSWIRFLLTYVVTSLVTVLLSCEPRAELRLQEAEARAETSSSEQLDARADELAALMADVIDERGATPAEVRAKFRADLQLAVPESVVKSLTDRMRGPGDVRLERLVGEAGAGAASRSYRYLFTQDDNAWTAEYGLDETGAAVSWFIGLGARHVGREQLTRETKALAGDWSLALRELDAEGRLVEDVVLANVDGAMPLGSAFKLYVLAELMRNVGPDGLDLEQTLEIREDWKSIPSGQMHALEAGTPVSLRELASKMISASDNTATDHLVHFLGRESIEEHLAEYRNSAPAENTPFLTTLDMFVFKGVGKQRRSKVFGERDLDEAARAWSEAGADQRRAWREALLEAGVEGRSYEKLRGSLLMGYGPATLGSKEHARVEWFARPLDLVELVTDAERGQLVDARTSELFLEFLGHGSPQYPMPGVAERGFKGGSETGVFVLCTRIVMDDGREVIGAICRNRLDPRDASAGERTVQLFNDWFRNLLDGEPVATHRAEPEPESEPGGGQL